MTRLALILPAILSLALGAEEFRPRIPKTWDEKELIESRLPLAESTVTPIDPPESYYSKIPALVLYKSYPIYHPDKEPAGYIEWLLRQEPQIAFDSSRLKTTDDWIRAGETVFQTRGVEEGEATLADLRNTVHSWVEEFRMPVAADGTLPFYRYTIRKKGEIRISDITCATCHTRVAPDGGVIAGAQGNLPGFILGFGDTPEFLRKFLRFLYGAPWIRPDPLVPIETMSIAQINAALQAIPPGVLPRSGSSLFTPVAVPDLIGIRDRRYLDRTGMRRHRGIGDLMRYASLALSMEMVSRYGDFRPASYMADLPRTELPDPAREARYSDDQLYALALYLYSLKPPRNPNPFDRAAAQGQKVFEREGCPVCHTPPQYTNNKLTPVEGFRIPAEHLKKYDIVPVVVGTDPDLALKTRRGTGYYKVPSLKGVWYRGPFEHSGSVATLEDWFDAARLRDDYVPTGFKGWAVETRAVKGHEFGLKLSQADKSVLIAFLKTL
jgi:hypothetical protein